MDSVTAFFGKKLKEIREAEGLTMAEFAQKVGVVQSTITLYERGQRSPSIDILARICRACGVSADSFLGLGVNMLSEDDVSHFTGLPLKAVKPLNLTRVVSNVTYDNIGDLFLDVVDTPRYNELISPLGHDGLCKLLSSQEGKEVLHLVGLYLNAGGYSFADGAAFCAIDAGTVRNAAGSTHGTIKFTADMISNFVLNEINEKLRELKAKPPALAELIGKTPQSEGDNDE